MFNKFVSFDVQGDEPKKTQKRQHARRADDRCVSIINGQMHPVENWSVGGMMIAADEKLFAMGQECIFTLKFKLRDKIMEVDHKAKIVRKVPDKVALQFLPLSKTVQTGFQKVIDDYVTQRFVESQS